MLFQRALCSNIFWKCPFHQDEGEEHVIQWTRSPGTRENIGQKDVVSLLLKVWQTWPSVHAAFGLDEDSLAQRRNNPQPWKFKARWWFAVNEVMDLAINLSFPPLVRPHEKLELKSWILRKLLFQLLIFVWEFQAYICECRLNNHSEVFPLISETVFKIFHSWKNFITKNG